MRGESSASAGGLASDAERSALIQAIADLDDARAAGQVDAEGYQLQRRRLLDALVRLLENGPALAA